jgi:putative FmdB family regulatory protein
MPIYEYKCKACGNEFEYQQRMSDPPKAECEQCGGGLEKQISRSSFALKGGGWYKDLYSSPKPKGGSSESTSPAKESPSSSGGDSSGSGSGSSGSGSSGSGTSSASSTTPAAAGK